MVKNWIISKSSNFICTLFLCSIMWPLMAQDENNAIVYPPITVREGKGLVLPLPPNEHPRVFIRKADIPAIREKLNAPLMKGCWDKVNQSAAYVTDGKLEQGNVTQNMNMIILNAIEAKAFMYVFTNNKEMGNQAVNLIFNYNNTLMLDGKKGDVCRDFGRVILATAVVYDWCYDLLSPNQKQQLIDKMERLASKMEVEWPLLKQNSVSGHGVEAQVAREMLACGIATFNEKPEIYNRAAGWLFAEVIPARKFWYQSGSQPQGSSYGPYRYQWEIYTTLLFDRMGYPNTSGNLQGKVPYRWIYTRRPDGQLLRDADDFTEQFLPLWKYWAFSDNAYSEQQKRDPRYYIEPIVCPLAYVANYFNDPVLMGEAIKQKLIGCNPLYDLLFVNPNIVPDYNLSALPLTKYFPSPLGGMVARTGWDEGREATSVVAEMKIGEYHFAGHHHLDAGSFQIYYKGPLAVQSGNYQGIEGSYGGNHFKNYYQRTIAHNCMLVYNPNEKFTWHRTNICNDGGQRYPGGAAEPNNMEVVLSNEYKKAEVLAHNFGPDTLKPEYSYLKGDITRAYTDKVKKHKRAFVFLNLNNANVPAAMVVYDYVVSMDKDFKKTWLLHCVQEPVFNGNVSTVVCNEKGYTGQLINTTLLPLSENLNLTKVGGKENEYSVNGVNYPQRIVAENNSSDGAIWRIEVSPKNASSTNNFLNVMQVMDYNNKPLKTEKVETEKLVGAKIGDRIVLFSKDSELINEPVKLEISGNGVFKVLITDLVKGSWKVSGSGNSFKTINGLENTNGLVYFKAGKGVYTISKI